ncbi:hypothetical protein LINPERPRIM_LOCUS34608 [Linum perenne]
MPHPLRSGSMAQHEAIAARHGNNSPTTPPSPSIEQLVRGFRSSTGHRIGESNGGEAMRWNPPNSSSSPQQDTECENTPQQKKSVLAKVKEKAKKWGRSLSKKKHNDDGANHAGNTTPSWGVSLDDEDDDEPENLGAPMYETEVASIGYRNAARARPRNQPHHAPALSAPLVLEKPASTATTTTSSSLDSRRNKSPTSKMHIAAGKQPQVSQMTLAETLKEKPAPPQPHNAPKAIPSEAQNLSVSTSSAPSGTKPELQAPGSTSSSSSTSRQEVAIGGTIKPSAPSSAPAAASSVTWKHSPEVKPNSAPKQSAPGPLNLEQAAPAPIATKPANPEATAEHPRAYSAPAPGEGAALDTGRTNSEQIWDKGVSVKEYILNKLEPSEDAKALSRVISQAMSPRKAPGDAGVVEKVKEVVSSLWQEDYSSSSSTSSSSSSLFASQSASQSTYHPLSYNAPPSPHIPISTNSTEVEEETQGRILQAN